MRAADVETGRDESVRARLVQELLRFFGKNREEWLEDAVYIFWDDFDPEQYLDEEMLRLTDINFREWVVFDHIVDEDNGRTLIDLYMESNRRLSADEHRILSMMKNSVLSLYEVQEVFPEKGLLLKDLLLGGEYDVQEKAATRRPRKWDIFAARLLPVEGAFIMSGSVYPYHSRQKETMLEYIRAEFEDYRLEYPGAVMDDFLKKNSEIFNFYWFDIIQNPPPMKFSTTSGEPLLFSKAIFEMKDRQAFIGGLQKIEGFEQGEDGFVWIDKRNKEGRATILGNIEITGDKLLLECNSKKRLEKGKKLILERVSGVLIHKADSFQDPEPAVKSYEGEREGKEKNQIPPEIRQKVYNQYMQKHYEKWLTEKIPALNGKTPLQAIKNG